jgi:Lrp/AsnC family transcriptional regulator for asnA, asnC and gidA
VWKAAIQEITQFNEVHMTTVLTGRYDGFILASFTDRDKLYDFLVNKLTKIKGLISFQSDMILTQYFQGKKIESVTDQKKNIQIDELDHRLITILQKNGRTNYNKIGRELNISSSTVSYRVNRLVKHKIIRRFTTIFNYSKLGYNIEAYVYLRIDPIKLKVILGELLKFKEVQFIMETSGNRGLIFNVRFPSRTQFHDFLNTKLDPLPGIQDIRTNMVLKFYLKHFV